MQAYKWADIPEEQSVVICMRRFKEFEKGFIKACNEGDIVKANSYKQEYKYLNLKVEYEELKNFVYSYAQFCWGL